MKLLDLLPQQLIEEANLRNLYTKSVNETPKMAKRGEQLQGKVRYFGLSPDGTLNFKIASQTRPGKYHYSYIEAPDILRFGEVIESGDQFNEQDLSSLLNMDGFRVHCNCEAFLYWTFQYMATQGNYEIQPETRAPKRNNTLLKGALCKHLQALVYNLFYNKQIRASLSRDINNYLRMIEGLDYQDYQQLNHAKQIKQQNRAVKWKNKPSDFMNDYFARQAKAHPFLDDHDIKKSLKTEITKFAKSQPKASLDDFLREYFQMTKKAFAEDMELPETSIDDYFEELGFSEKQQKQLDKEEQKEQVKQAVLNKDDTNNKGLNSGILTKDSEQLTEAEKKYLWQSLGDILSEMIPDASIIMDPVRIAKDKFMEELHFNNIKVICTINSKVEDDGWTHYYLDLGKDPQGNQCYQQLSWYNAKRGLSKENREQLDRRIKQEQSRTAKRLTEAEKFYKDSKEAEDAYNAYIEGHVANVNEALELLHTLDIPFVNEHYDEIKEICSVHDDSKWSDKEYFPYLHHFYPTNEDEANMEEEFELACDIHCYNNRHHWNCGDWIDYESGSLKGGFDQVVYMKYTVERICDWLAMAYQHGEEPTAWWNANKEAIKMPDYAVQFTDEVLNKVPKDFKLKFKVTRGDLDETEVNNG